MKSESQYILLGRLRKLVMHEEPNITGLTTAEQCAQYYFIPTKLQQYGEGTRNVVAQNNVNQTLLSILEQSGCNMLFQPKTLSDGVLSLL